MYYCLAKTSIKIKYWKNRSPRRSPDSRPFGRTLDPRLMNRIPYPQLRALGYDPGAKTLRQESGIQTFGQDPGPQTLKQDPRLRTLRQELDPGTSDKILCPRSLGRAWDPGPSGRTLDFRHSSRIPDPGPLVQGL